MAKILVTGAAGFMGSHLVDTLIKEGHEVFGIDDLSGGYKRNVNPKSRFYKADLRNRKEIDEIVSEVKPDILYHLAADATEGRSQFTPINCTERGILAYINAITPCINNGIRKVIVTSSISIYGSQKPPFDESMPRKPDDVYGVNKAALEEVTEILSDVYGFAYVILRPHNVYGEKQNLADPYRNVIGIWINALFREKPIYIYGDGEQLRAFSYIQDVTPCIIKAGFSDKCTGEIINIGGKEPVTINKVARIIMEEFGRETEVIHLPSRPKEVKYAYSTHQKSERLLDYEERFSLREGIKRMIKWAKVLGPQEPVYMDAFEIEDKKIPKTWTEKLI